MSNKTIIFSHGDKGGVGKSTALIWLIENAISRGLDFGIVETDPKIPDVGDRYKKTHDVIFAPLEEVGESDALEGISRMFEGFVALDKPVVFVNLPAAASMRLDPSANLISDALADAGYSLRVAFVADDRGHSRALLEKSLEKGIMSFADENVILLNSNFGGGKVDSWPIMKANTYGKEPSASVLPKISDLAWKIVNQYAAPLNDLMPELGFVHRQALKYWIKAADEPLNALLATRD